eukprot:symbB.v1.2.024306.t1/scaffold2280.1/size83482/4
MWRPLVLCLALARTLQPTEAYVPPAPQSRPEALTSSNDIRHEAPPAHDGVAQAAQALLVSFGAGCVLGISRRRFMTSVASIGGFTTSMANALAIGRSEERTEMRVVDINNASVTEYQQFKGLYPSGAAIISGNGPYNQVEDVYNLRGIKDNDIMKAIIKKYEPYLECRTYAPKKASRMTYKGND